jgi:alkanesulfonate monooxygenase SsuD/methylene tetrahydromethanopterin reductase-like flavin-dependent oxidoreductase (luciferase family)
MEVNHGSALGIGATHRPTLFLQRVMRQVAQRADALGFLDLWVTGDTNV